MNAFKSNIYKYLEGTCQYLIPLYQRTYSWKREQCSRLWSDIVNLHHTHQRHHNVIVFIHRLPMWKLAFPGKYQTALCLCR
jgi:hypothetical protein